MINQTMPRMRTLDAAYALVQEVDPGTSLTRHALRALAVGGRIPAVKVGNKRLLNVDALLDLLMNDPDSLSIESSETSVAAPLLPVRRLIGQKRKH
jgi:hypothetical protein